MRHSIAMSAVISILFLSCLSFTATAGDEGLYDKDAPTGAAFFRVFNGSDSTLLKVMIGAEKVASVAPLSVTGYGFTEKAELHLSLNGKILVVPTPAKSICTVVWGGQESFVVSEEVFVSKKKARLKLFNIGAQPLTLKTADGKTNVIEGVLNQQYGYRDINALNVDFAFFEGESSILSSEKISLKKGQVTSLFLVKKGSTPIYVQAEEQR